MKVTVTDVRTAMMYVYKQDVDHSPKSLQTKRTSSLFHGNRCKNERWQSAEDIAIMLQN